MEDDKSIHDIIEDFQEAIIKSGGKFIRSKEISSMTVHELLKLITPNGVTIEVGNASKEAHENEYLFVLKTLEKYMKHVYEYEETTYIDEQFYVSSFEENEYSLLEEVSHKVKHN